MYYYEDYYTRARTITQEQAHIIAERAANTAVKKPIHRKIDSMRGALEVAKQNGIYRIFCGTVNLCELYEKEAAVAIKDIFGE